MARAWTSPAHGAYLSQPALPLIRQVVSIDDWTPLGIEQIGSKPKQWFAAKDGTRWLFKKVVENPTKSGQLYLRGDDWAEVVSSDIGRLLGLPTATVELAEQHSWPGVISRTVAGDASLILGNEFLAGRDPAYAANTDRINPMYTVNRVMAELQNIDGPPDSNLTAPAAFAGYLLLDAVIGNTDRHHQNSALLQRVGSGIRYLAPTFDHASSLGFLLSDAERSERITGDAERRSVMAYAKKARTPFSQAVNPIDAARQALSLVSKRERLEWVTAAHALSEEVQVAIDRVPRSRMSTVSREFALVLVRYNLEVLLREARRVG